MPFSRNVAFPPAIKGGIVYWIVRSTASGDGPRRTLAASSSRSSAAFSIPKRLTSRCALRSSRAWATQPAHKLRSRSRQPLDPAISEEEILAIAIALIRQRHRLAPWRPFRDTETVLARSFVAGARRAKRRPRFATTLWSWHVYPRALVRSAVETAAVPASTSIKYPRRYRRAASTQCPSTAADRRRLPS